MIPIIAIAYVTIAYIKNEVIDAVTRRQFFCLNQTFREKEMLSTFIEFSSLYDCYLITYNLVRMEFSCRLLKHFETCKNMI